MKKLVTIIAEQESNGLVRVLLPNSLSVTGRVVPVTLSFNQDLPIGRATDFERDGDAIQMLVEVWDDNIAMEVFNDRFWQPSVSAKIIETKRNIDPEIKILDVSKAELMEIAFVLKTPGLRLETG